MNYFRIRDIEKMENEQEKLSGKSYMESLYGIPFNSTSIQTSAKKESDKIPVKIEKGWKREFILGLTIGMLLLLATVILHKLGLI